VWYSSSVRSRLDRFVATVGATCVRVRPWLLVATLACGCSPSRGDAYKLALAQATRAESAGRFGEAATSYERASEVAKVDRDKSYTLYLSAMMRAQAGDRAEALKRLDVIAAREPPTDDSAAAMYRAALLRIDGGEAERGWADLEKLLSAFPSHGVTRNALGRLLRHHQETEGPEKTGAWLAKKATELDATELGQIVQYQRARLLEDAKDFGGAEKAFIALADRYPYPRGVHFDDALFRASEAAEKQGRPAVAIEYLERLLKEREASHLMGTYERPRYIPAQKRIATLYETALHDRPRARAAWHRLYAEFKTAVDRDDALWHEAQLWRDDGDVETSCARLSTLVSALPDSRYVPCATKLCPGVARPAKSKAPAECHDYILRPKESEPDADEPPTAP